MIVILNFAQNKSKQANKVIFCVLILIKKARK